MSRKEHEPLKVGKYGAFNLFFNWFGSPIFRNALLERSASIDRNILLPDHLREEHITRDMEANFDYTASPFRQVVKLVRWPFLLVLLLYILRAAANTLVLQILLYHMLTDLKAGKPYIHYLYYIAINNALAHFFEVFAFTMAQTFVLPKMLLYLSLSIIKADLIKSCEPARQLCGTFSLQRSADFSDEVEKLDSNIFVQENEEENDNQYMDLENLSQPTKPKVTGSGKPWWLADEGPKKPNVLAFHKMYKYKKEVKKIQYNKTAEPITIALSRDINLAYQKIVNFLSLLCLAFPVFVFSQITVLIILGPVSLVISVALIIVCGYICNLTSKKAQSMDMVSGRFHGQRMLFIQNLCSTFTESKMMAQSKDYIDAILKIRFSEAAAARKRLAWGYVSFVLGGCTPLYAGVILFLMILVINGRITEQDIFSINTIFYSLRFVIGTVGLVLESFYTIETVNCNSSRFLRDNAVAEEYKGLIPLKSLKGSILGAFFARSSEFCPPKKMLPSTSNPSTELVEHSPNLDKLINCINELAQPGSITAVVGYVGCGKSTFLKLVRDLSLSIPDLFTTVRFAPQTPVILSGTILSNILMGRTATEEEIELALIRSCLLTDLQNIYTASCKEKLKKDQSNIPDNSVNSKYSPLLEAYVSEGGSTLSGGQKYRLSLARTLLGVKGTPDELIIFDDPLAGLDSSVASDVMNNIIDLADRGARVVIALNQAEYLALVNKIVVCKYENEIYKQLFYSSISSVVKNEKNLIPSSLFNLFSSINDGDTTSHLENMEIVDEYVLYKAVKTVKKRRGQIWSERIYNQEVYAKTLMRGNSQQNQKVSLIEHDKDEGLRLKPARQGPVAPIVWLYFLALSPPGRIFLALLGFIGFYGSLAGRDVWMTTWIIESSISFEQFGYNKQLGKHILIFLILSVLGICSAIFMKYQFLTSFTSFMLHSMRDLITHLAKTPVDIFYGRVINKPKVDIDKSDIKNTPEMTKKQFFADIDESLSEKSEFNKNNSTSSQLLNNNVYTNPFIFTGYPRNNDEDQGYPDDFQYGHLGENFENRDELESGFYDYDDTNYYRDNNEKVLRNHSTNSFDELYNITNQMTDIREQTEIGHSTQYSNVSNNFGNIDNDITHSNEYYDYQYPDSIRNSSLQYSDPKVNKSRSHTSNSLPSGSFIQTKDLEPEEVEMVNKSRTKRQAFREELKKMRFNKSTAEVSVTPKSPSSRLNKFKSPFSREKRQKPEIKYEDVPKEELVLPKKKWIYSEKYESVTAGVGTGNVISRLGSSVIQLDIMLMPPITALAYLIGATAMITVSTMVLVPYMVIPFLGAIIVVSTCIYASSVLISVFSRTGRISFGALTQTILEQEYSRDYIKSSTMCQNNTKLTGSIEIDGETVDISRTKKLVADKPLSNEERANINYEINRTISENESASYLLKRAAIALNEYVLSTSFTLSGNIPALLSVVFVDPIIILLGILILTYNTTLENTLRSLVLSYIAVWGQTLYSFIVLNGACSVVGTTVEHLVGPLLLKRREESKNIVHALVRSLGSVFNFIKNLNKSVFNKPIVQTMPERPRIRDYAKNGWNVTEGSVIKKSINAVKYALGIKYAALPATSFEWVDSRFLYHDILEERWVKPNDPPTDVWPVAGKIEYKDVSLSYNLSAVTDETESGLVANSINLDIYAGEHVCFVGRTGAGKTTLVNSLFRLMEPIPDYRTKKHFNTGSPYDIGATFADGSLNNDSFDYTIESSPSVYIRDPHDDSNLESELNDDNNVFCNILNKPNQTNQDFSGMSKVFASSPNNNEFHDTLSTPYGVAGKICIDGIDISTLGLFTLRKALAVIPQNPAILPTTVRDNVDPFKVYDDDQLEDALKRVGLDVALTEYLGTGGLILSVGQKQLLYFAKLLLEKDDRKVLVLDEATAYIDPITEKRLHTLLLTEFATTTIISVAHRRSTILQSDRVFWLEEGKVKAEGTPLEILCSQSNTK